MTNYSNQREVIMRESILTYFGSWALNTYASSQNTKFKEVVDGVVHTYGKLAEANSNQTQISVVEEGVTYNYRVTDYKVMSSMHLSEMLNVGKVFTTSQMEGFNSTCISKADEAFKWVKDDKILSPSGLNNAYELLKLFSISVGSLAAVDKKNYKLLGLSHLVKFTEANGVKTQSLYIGEGDNLSKATICYLGLHASGLDMSYFFEVTERVMDKDSIALALSANKSN